MSCFCKVGMSHSPGLNDAWENADGIGCDERMRSAADRGFVKGDRWPLLNSVPHLTGQSITFDRGTQFAEWRSLQPRIGTQRWFCDPQNGTVVNTNRRVRNWLSRDVDPLSITDGDLKDLCDQLNSTRRKCLCYRMSAERSFARNCSLDRACGIAQVADVAIRSEIQETGSKRRLSTWQVAGLCARRTRSARGTAS